MNAFEARFAAAVAVADADGFGSAMAGRPAGATDRTSGVCVRAVSIGAIAE